VTLYSKIIVRGDVEKEISRAVGLCALIALSYRRRCEALHQHMEVRASIEKYSYIGKNGFYSLGCANAELKLLYVFFLYYKKVLELLIYLLLHSI
jgi:hypothetical protein